MAGGVGGLDPGGSLCPPGTGMCVGDCGVTGAVQAGRGWVWPLPRGRASALDSGAGGPKVLSGGKAVAGKGLWVELW